MLAVILFVIGGALALADFFRPGAPRLIPASVAAIAAGLVAEHYGK